MTRNFETHITNLKASDTQNSGPNPILLMGYNWFYPFFETQDNWSPHTLFLTSTLTLLLIQYDHY